LRSAPTSRRQLLRAAGALGIGSALAATGCASSGANAGESHVASPADGPAQVPTRPFGRSGERVSALALGGYFDALANQDLLADALALGVNYWETTLSFGGKGYGEYFRRHPEHRQRVFLLAKTNGASTEQMEQDLRTTLADVGTSHVDFFIIGSIRDGSLLTPEVQRWVEMAKATEKIRYFGFSTHSNMEECLLLASRLSWIDGVLTTYNYRLKHRPAMREAVDACAERGIAITAIKSQALDTNPEATIGEDTDEATEALRGHLAAGRDLFQARLQAVWENPQISSICSMMTDRGLLRANARAALGESGTAGAALAGAGALGLGGLAGGAPRPSRRYCAGCASVCEGTLGAPLPVADVMRYLMYARSYGDRERARREFAALPAEVRVALSRQDYRLAEQRCPEQLPIGRLMREATLEL
jgi:predicted aldo/keto reductase-like oxidoreductase